MDGIEALNAERFQAAINALCLKFEGCEHHLQMASALRDGSQKVPALPCIFPDQRKHQESLFDHHHQARRMAQDHAGKAGNDCLHYTVIAPMSGQW